MQSMQDTNGFCYVQLLFNNEGEAADFIFLDLNPAMVEFIGFGGINLTNKMASELLYTDNQFLYNMLGYFERAIKSGITQEATVWINHLCCNYELRVIPSSGLKAAAFLKKIDIVDEGSGFAANGRSILEGLDSVFDRTHDAMLLIEYSNSEFRFVRSNMIHKQLSGFTSLQGKTPVEVLGEELGNKLIGYYNECLSTGKPVTYEQDYHFLNVKRTWQTILTPFCNHNGAFYILSASQDVTELKSAQGEKDILSKRLQAMFQQHTAVMLFIEPLSGRIVDANPAACQFYGYTREELLELHIGDINMLPADELLRRRLMAYEERQQYFLFPHRLKNSDIRLVDVYSCPISDGNKVLLHSIIYDVTDRETFKNKLYREKEILRTTLSSIGDGVVSTDSGGIITSMNNIAQDITGWPNHEAVGRRFEEVFRLRNEETGQPIENPIRKVLNTGRIVGLANHTVLINRLGETIPIADSAAPIRAEDGHIFGVVMVFRDISAERRQTSHIKYLSYHDSLTGLYNRRYIEENLKIIDIPENLPLSVIMGDVNGLKITNDVFGHEAGDKLLKYLAESLNRFSSEKDYVARWGGDEFVIILPKTRLSEAEELIVNIKNNSIAIDEGGLRMSVSFGCATKNAAEESVQEVLRQAEEYMYHQKLLDGKSYRNAIINTLLATLYEKSTETEEHALRMQKHCSAMGARLRLSSKEMDELSLLAILHDIGKVGINPDILKKPSSLLPAEWEEMKRHPEIGYRIAQATPELATVADYILSHHERWDGRGYPRGLKGEEIPMVCRILAIADAYDAMTNDRIYRRGLGREAAVTEIRKNSGTQFDPDITELFLKMLSEDNGMTYYI
jgi:diguanylate cyclase (GGDEF)-like protein/PAS domain S-box-containing protein